MFKTAKIFAFGALCYALTALLDAHDARALDEPEAATAATPGPTVRFRVYDDGIAIWACPIDTAGPCVFQWFIDTPIGAKKREIKA